MGPDLWAFIIVSIVAVVLLLVALCDAASGADDAIDEWARGEDARVYDFPERRR